MSDSWLVDTIKAYCLEIAPKGEYFTLKSGAKSKYYLDVRKLSLHANVEKIIGAIWFTLENIDLSSENLDAVGGPCVGADPIVGAFLYAENDVYNGIERGFLVRKESKGHGKADRVIGSVRPGDRCLMIEDVTTSGGSTLDAIDAVEDFGAKVVQIISVVDRMAGAKEKFEERGIPFHALVNIEDLGIADLE